MTKKRKAEYDKSRLQSADSKETFKILGELLSQGQEVVLPSSKDDAELANRFADFFHNKGMTIRNELDKLPDMISPSSENGDSRHL